MSESDGDRRSSGLTKHVVTASIWAIGGGAASQILRFASNLILSRLLFPETFGIMALASAVISGLEMLSDLGVGPAIIRNREPTQNFLDSLWSLQVVRGWGQWAVSAVLAYPMALWYREPTLVYLIPAIGIVSIIRGYAHTSQFTLNRELKLRELFFLELYSQIAAISVSTIAAFELRSVWALLLGSYAGSLSRTVQTHLISAGRRRHWCWDRDVFKSISGFSRWILLSTILTFVTNQGNSLILASFASLTFVGLYSIANNIAGIAVLVFSLLGDRVLFPLYGSVGRETTPLLKQRIIKIRLALMVIILPPLCVMTCFGDLFIRLLWDVRYHDAGPMLQLLCGGSLFLAFGVGPMYLARGEAWVGVVINGVRAAVLLPALSIGARWLGPIGLVYGTAFTRMIDYPLEVWFQRRYGVWVPWVDGVGLGVSAGLIALGFLLRAWLHF
jgi:O-antigen/teichoic acid export membrane protein